MRELRLPSAALLGAALLHWPAFLQAQDLELPAFEYGISPCPLLIERSPDVSFELTVDLTLTTSDNPSETSGAQGWSLSIASSGVELTAITTQGTVSASVTDDPPGLRSSGFEKSAVTTTQGKGACEPDAGAVSAVVLSFIEIVTLPPVGTVTVARLTASGEALAVLGERRPASIFHFDGCAAGGGGPVMNTITWNGQTAFATLARCDFEIGAAAELFRRGDPNADHRVDLSDAVMILGCKFLGERCPGCRDAGDANDDGLMDLSDAVYILSFLFLGGLPPGPPAGQDVCGADPTPDSLPECRQAGC